MSSLRDRRIADHRADLLAMAALALLGVAFLFEMVAMDAVPVARDNQLFFLPHKHILWEALQSGEIPLWTPLIRTGYPVLANFQSGVFYPPHWLYASLPFLTGFNLLVVLHLLLGGAGFYLLCRRLDFGPAPSWVAAASYMLGGYFVSLTNLINVLQAAAWAPAMVAVLVHHVRRWRPATLAGMVAVYLLGFLAGEPQTFLVVSGTALVFAVVWSAGRADLPGSWKRPLGAMAVTAAAVAGLAAVQILPTMEMISHAGRGKGLTVEQSGRYSLVPVRLVHLVVPNDFTDPVYRFGGKLQLSAEEPWLFSVYVGLVSLVLAWHARWDRARRREVVFWTVAALAGVVLALGEHLPLFHWLHAHLPGFSAFRYPEKFFVLTGIAVPMLAAHGTGAILRRPDPDGLDRAAALVTLTAALGALAVWAGLPSRVHGWIRALSPDAPMLDAFPFAYLQWGTNLEVAAAVLAASVGLVGLHRKGHLRRFVFVGLLCAVVSLDFWLADRDINPVVDRSFYTEPPAVHEVLDLEELRRTYRYRGTPYDEHIGTLYSYPDLPTHAAKWMWQQTMQPATGALWGVMGHDAEDAIHLDPIRDTDELLRELGPAQRRRILRLGSVKYVYRPLPTADLPRAKAVAVDSVPGFVFSLEDPVPRAYLAHGRIVREEIDAVNAMLAPEMPYLRQVMIVDPGPGDGEDGEPAVREAAPADVAVRDGEIPEGVAGAGREDSAARGEGPPGGEAGGGDSPASPGRGTLPDPGSARIVADEGERIRIRVAPDTASWLVLTDTWYPGWHAYVDGEERPVRKANYFFRAVPVRPGDETVEFRYRSEPLRRGGVVSLASLALLLAGLGGWRLLGGGGGADPGRGGGRKDGRGGARGVTPGSASGRPGPGRRPGGRP